MPMWRIADSRNPATGKRDVADVADTGGFREATDEELDLAERLQARAGDGMTTLVV